jgi:DNA-binding transcriptional regulator GbsR (MarR family)
MAATDHQVIRQRLVEAGARVSLDLGLGRMVGQILVYLYLSREECSLDLIGEELELSKASVSIAARQLEKLGMIVRIWKKGDRKCYYRTADNFTQALQQGIVEFIRQKLNTIEKELAAANMLLLEVEPTGQNDADLRFLNKRVDRMKLLTQRVQKVVENPLIKLLAG